MQTAPTEPLKIVNLKFISNAEIYFAFIDYLQIYN